MRNLSDVIDEMLKIIPLYRGDLIKRLKCVQTSSRFGAPEMQPEFWNRCADILTDEIPELKFKWQKQLGKIFNGENK